MTDDLSSNWRALIDALRPIADRVAPLMIDPDDPLLRQELHRLLLSQVSMAHFAMFVGDADNPDFWPLLNQAFNIFGPNPDMYYFQAPIEGSGTYRIVGFRGTTHIVDFQVGPGVYYNTGNGPPAKASANYHLDDLDIGADGYFEVILSNERPAGHLGNWWQTWPDTTNVHVRQISYDWLNELDARFVIERLDKPAARPRLTAQTIEERLSLIPGWVENWARVSMDLTRADHEAGLVNQLNVVTFAATGGSGHQKYVTGQWDLDPHEALLLETDVPDPCSYWGFVLNDMSYSVLDYTNRMCSLNGFQATLDADGKFRAVISATDPGVPNWLDTMGYQKGAFLGRWRGAASAPVPTVRKVAVAEARDYLPPDTPIVTPEMRDDVIRRRSRGARLRRRW